MGESPYIGMVMAMTFLNWRKAMNREREDTIELGVVSADTKGSTLGFADVEIGLQPKVGLSDD
jgi:hypothetical protein